jgi:AcrR family transcriptional regulator
VAIDEDRSAGYKGLTDMAGPQDRIPSRLPRGKHGLSPQFVARNQRERLISATITVVAEKGYAEATVADILEHSGVSRKTFYDLFTNKEDCFLSAYDQLIDTMADEVGEAFAGGHSWADRVRNGLRALLDLLAARPNGARVGLVEVLAAGPRALERYDGAIRRFVPLFEQGRSESPYGDQLPPNISEAVLGGIAQVLYLRVLAGEAASLPDALDELLYFALVPYLGHAGTTRVANARRSRHKTG